MSCQQCKCPVSGDAAQDIYEMNLPECCPHDAYEHDSRVRHPEPVR